jgi:hypothetical protein
MGLPKRSFIILGLGWFASIALASFVAGYYYIESQNLNDLLEHYEDVTMEVNICIEYKELNETVLWHNNTIVPLGCNLLQATETVALVNSTYSPAQQASFVDAINGVWNHGAHFWMWQRWNDTQEKWEYGNVGADVYRLTRNETVRWRYEIPSYT